MPRDKESGEGSKKTTYEAFLKQLNFAHEKAIPIDYLSEFTSHYRIPIGTILIVAYLAFFAYFTYYFYNENSKMQFVAIEEGTNTCTEVAKPLSSVVLASAYGVWEGATTFKYSDSPVIFTFREMTASTEEFIKFFEEQKDLISEVNKIFSENTLGLNILYWTTYLNSVQVGKTIQSLEFVGDPSNIFNGQILTGTVADATAVCSAPSTTSFDTQSSTFSLTYSYEDYIKYNCSSNNFDATQIALAIGGLTTTVTIKVDTRSFVTAMALNMGVLDTNNYDMQASQMSQVVVEGTQYSYYKVENVRYAGMTPVYCILDSWCMMRVGKDLFLPIFDHYGNSISNQGEPCNCENLTPWCNTFDFVLGLFYVGSLEDATYQWIVAVETFQGYFPAYSDFNNAVFPIMRLSASPGVPASYLEEVIGSTFPLMRLISIRSVNYEDSIISQYAYELINGSCNAVLTTALENWNELSATPPQSLVEPYITCFRNKSFSLYDALGIGMADCDLSMRFFAYLLLPFILFIMKRLIGVHLVDPAEHTLDVFVKTLHKAREQRMKEREKTGGATPSALHANSTAAAAEVIRLLSLALDEEVEEERLEEDEENDIPLVAVSSRVLGGWTSHKKDGTTRQSREYFRRSREFEPLPPTSEKVGQSVKGSVKKGFQQTDRVVPITSGLTDVEE